MIVGIDEVGRGPWAGPLVFGAVVLGDAVIEGLTDSKKLTKKRREVLASDIYSQARAIGLGWVTAAEIDQVGMSQALRVGCRRALEQITVPYDQIILDGTINFLSETGKGPYVTTLAKADLLIPSVSAASIVAKVARDAFMSDQDTIYDGYGFGSHAGYGTAAHKRALEVHGVTPLHRTSFAPIRNIMKQPVRVSDSGETTSTAIGQRAEDVAAAYLSANGYQIVARNWKTKACEIDIIATKSHTVHFVEVKYRRTGGQGGGIAAITPQKLRQMKRAATIWLQRHRATDAVLAVLEVAGAEYEVTQFLEQV